VGKRVPAAVIGQNAGRSGDYRRYEDDEPDNYDHDRTPGIWGVKRTSGGRSIRRAETDAILLFLGHCAFPARQPERKKKLQILRRARNIRGRRCRGPEQLFYITLP
jgi:hypothetical protein